MAFPDDVKYCNHINNTSYSLSLNLGDFTFVSVDDESLFIGVDFTWATGLGLHWKFGVSFEADE